jgi:GTP-binding protein LepA
VVYEVELTNGNSLLIDNPSRLPPPSQLKEIREPIIAVDILVPQDHLGNVINLCVEKRGVQKSLNFLGGQASISYLLPMAEVVTDFFDRLKSVTRGYASMDYQFSSYETAQVVKVDFLISGQQIDALSVIVHRDLAQKRGREIAAKMKSIIPRQMFDIAVQASLGSKIIARETIKALRKNVTAKCYGGDATRKRKLLEKQKAGKKRMKQLGSVDIPQEAFMAVLATNKNNKAER